MAADEPEEKTTAATEPAAKPSSPDPPQEGTGRPEGRRREGPGERRVEEVRRQEGGGPEGPPPPDARPRGRPAARHPPRDLEPTPAVRADRVPPIPPDRPVGVVAPPEGAAVEAAPPLRVPADGRLHRLPRSAPRARAHSLRVRPVIVRTIAEVEALDANRDAAIVARAVGTRRRLQLEEAARRRGVHLLNPLFSERAEGT